MKKIYSILFAAVALFSAASCQDELVNNEMPATHGEKFTVTAVTDVQTKTALTDEGFNSVWTPGDAIAVIDYAGSGAKFTTEITENAASAKFTCENFYVGGLDDISALPIVALYPYQDGLTCSIQSQLNPTGDNTVKGIVFPHEQTAVAGSFDKAAAFTWAMATGATKDDLQFNNLYSLLKVKVTEENITEIKVTATSGSLAGNVTLPMTQSGATLTVVDGEGKSEVTLTCENGFDTEKYYYICVLPGTYEGFSIALNGYTVKTKKTAATFEAATVYDLGEVARVVSKWGLVGSMTLWSDGQDVVMYKEGDYEVVKGVSIKTSDEFKFRTTNSWGTGHESISGGIVAPNTERTAGWVNMTITEDGEYDLYVDAANSKYYIMTSGKLPSEATTPSDITITVTCDKSGYTHLHMWSDGGAVANSQAATSPSKWTVIIPKGDQQNRDYQVIFHKGNWSEQTSDSEKMVLKNPMELTVSSDNKALYK